MAKGMGKGRGPGLMDPDTKVNGSTTRPMEEENCFTPMETSMRASGRMIWQTAMAHTVTPMELSTLVSG